MRTLLLTTPYLQGPDVAAIQARLYNVKPDGVYGERTGDAVKSWRWRTGFPTAVTGLGPAGQRILLGLDPLPAAYRVRARLRAASRPPVSVPRLALATMLGWARSGYTESPAGSNKVPQLAARAKALGLSDWYQRMGWPWCAFATSLSALEHGGQTAKAGFAGKFNTLYCPAILAEAKARRNGLTIIARPDVQPGDLVLFDFDGGVPDHIGRVAALRSSDFVSVEGNTSAAGSQNNGGSMLIKTRSYTLVEAFVRDK